MMPRFLARASPHFARHQDRRGKDAEKKKTTRGAILRHAHADEFFPAGERPRRGNTEAGRVGMGGSVGWAAHLLRACVRAEFFAPRTGWLSLSGELERVGERQEPETRGSDQVQVQVQALANVQDRIPGPQKPL
ncbi:unnamed protein product [Clonostachys byssicola]|uniref:Uncharacterized protein n=1 Tax=Clonostachys byssicola TaxID=160290 RepID=A0A9N9U6T1_9HYPO|nr:unnamed protein product [Clonostachys byssicola]